LRAVAGACRLGSVDPGLRSPAPLFLSFMAVLMQGM